jgi:hypothetical protein
LIRRERKRISQTRRSGERHSGGKGGYEATQCQQYHRAFPRETRIAGGARTEEFAWFVQRRVQFRCPDKNGTRQKEIFENEQVRVSTTSVPKGTNWSAPHDGRDRVVVLLDKVNQIAETNEKDSSSSAWKVTWIPANSDVNVRNKSDQTENLMILEFKDRAAEQAVVRTEAPTSKASR